MVPFALAAAIMMPAALALPTLGDDDAGSGMDAPDAGSSGVALGGGSFNGRLTHGADVSDTYSLNPPTLSVIRVSILSGAVSAHLTDPNGAARGNADPFFPDTSAIAMPSGAWLLRVDLPLALGTGAISYSVSVAYEQHEHGASFSEPNGTNHTFAISAPKGFFARADQVRSETHTNPFLGSTLYASISTFVLGPDQCRTFGNFQGTAGVTGRTAASIFVANGPSAAVPAPEISLAGGLSPSVGELPTGGRFVETFVDLDGLQETVYTLWDDAISFAGFVPGIQTLFLRDGDFRPDAGASVHVGPLGGVREGEFPFSNARTGPSLLFLDASKTVPLEALSKVDTVLPDGSVESIEGSSLLRAFSTTPLGRFNVRLYQGEGLNPERVRTAWISLPPVDFCVS